jgi:uncharacterized protein YaaR (DUF327 family)
MSGSTRADVGPSTEQTLYNIALECEVFVVREDGQTLADFAETVKSAIADKIIELNDSIDEIDGLLTDEDEEGGE